MLQDHPDAVLHLCKRLNNDILHTFDGLGIRYHYRVFLHECGCLIGFQRFPFGDTDCIQLPFCNFWNARGSVLVEFLVGKALNIVEKPRVEQDAYDLKYGDIKIEVKSSSDLQSWEQAQLSKPVFSLSENHAWDAESNTFADHAMCSADCYVFCLFAATDHDQADMLDTNQWEFYVLTTAQIDQQLGYQKSISLNPLREMTKAVAYADLRTTIDSLFR